ncbi:hypothetical protein L1887_16489 [Cichorium endivia]|nr:hypothetical protein L1887_16489 [Cichorium endivia]
MASFYVAGRLWEDAEDRVYLGKELDRITSQGKSTISVDETLKIIGCSSSEGFVSDHLSKTKKKRPLVMIGVLTGFGRMNNREVIRKAWMSTGEALKKMEVEKGVIARFVIGRRCYALIPLLSTS